MFRLRQMLSKIFKPNFPYPTPLIEKGLFNARVRPPFERVVILPLTVDGEEGIGTGRCFGSRSKFGA